MNYYNYCIKLIRNNNGSNVNNNSNNNNKNNNNNNNKKNKNNNINSQASRRRQREQFISSESAESLNEPPARRPNLLSLLDKKVEARCILTLVYLQDLAEKRYSNFK